MKKKFIRLTESDLHNIVKGSVKNIVSEGSATSTRKQEIQKKAFEAAFNHGINAPSFVIGAEWADETMLDRVIDWLKEHINDYLTHGRDIDYIFDDLRNSFN